MAKPRPQGKPPSGRNAPHGRQGSEDARDLAAREVSARLQQIAEGRTPPPPPPPKPTPTTPTPDLGIQLPGAEAADEGLFRRRSTAEVVSLHAYVHPDQPETVVLRLDGWDGPLVLHLPRDRAALLISRLGEVVEESRERSRRRPAGAAGTPAAGVEVVVGLAGRRTKVKDRRGFKPRPGGPAADATDALLDELADEEYADLAAAVEPEGEGGAEKDQGKENG